MRKFGSIFRNVADAGDWGTSLARFHLGQAVSSADADLVAQIENATASWCHVREAVAVLGDD